MTEEIKNQDPNATIPPGASSGGEPAAPPATPPTKVEPKFEVKEGSYFVDGKKMVAESDLIAAKKSLETQLETQQAAHVQAIDAVNLDLSAERKNVADLTAKLTTAQEAQGKGAASSEDVARIEQERADALAKVESLTAQAGQALDLRRALLKLQYPGVTDESLANKDWQALDSYEEALKAVTASRGTVPGAYAVGAGMGGTAQMTDMERARAVLDNTPVRGVREPAEQK